MAITRRTKTLARRPGRAAKKGTAVRRTPTPPRPLRTATMAAKAAQPRITFHSATADRWADVVKLFGPRGACAGCWCQWPRLPAAEYRSGSGAVNKRRLERLVRGGARPGLLAYADNEPIGWCAFASRTEYPRLETSRVMAPVDDQPVWSVTCFFVNKDWRGRGIAVRMLKEAARQAAAQGARILEGYPTATSTRQSAAFVWTGLATQFEQAGFKEVARRSPSRPIMRRVLRKPARAARG